MANKIDTSKVKVQNSHVEGSVTSDDLTLSKEKVVSTVIDENKAELSKQKLAEQMGSAVVTLKSVPKGKEKDVHMKTGNVYSLTRDTLDFFQDHGFEFELK